MSDFPKRLNAAIDQAEQREQAALAEAPGDWRVHETGDNDSREYIVVAYGPDGPDCDVMITGSRADAERVAANGPNAVLRNIAAARNLLHLADNMRIKAARIEARDRAQPNSATADPEASRELRLHAFVIEQYVAESFAVESTLEEDDDR